VKQLEESLSGRVAIEHLAENTLGSLMPGIIYGKMKRIAELLLSIVAIPLFLPLMMIVAVLIKLDSKGPVLFTQERMGYRGRPFRIYKFRSMSNARPASEGHAAAITEAGDRRITRVGKHIRRFRIDELPQVFNVLKGDMSWIGPRPEAELLSVWYEVELPFYRYRHIVRPGITGWAQVNQGHVAELADVHWKLQYDFFYIKNFSFWLDVLILARTVRIILGGFGAR
jgi:lipopolysaccharide/colanic/teichoic acid biosynthesis glycosyltransferase